MEITARVGDTKLWLLRLEFGVLKYVDFIQHETRYVELTTAFDFSFVKQQEDASHDLKVEEAQFIHMYLLGFVDGETGYEHEVITEVTE